MVLSDCEIRALAKQGMITPFSEGVSEAEGRKVISYGLTSYGYDVRLKGGTALLAGPTMHDAEYIDGLPIRIDPKKMSPGTFRPIKSIYDDKIGDECYIVPPHGFMLCESVEHMYVPRELMVIALGKSTYARCGLIANVTPLEPQWAGTITLELSNTTPLPVVVYANEGIVQLVFHRASEVCERSYSDKAGRYQNQKGVTHAKM